MYDVKSLYLIKTCLQLISALLCISEFYTFELHKVKCVRFLRGLNIAGNLNNYFH